MSPFPTDDQAGIGTFIGVGVGIGMLLLVVLTLVSLVVVVVVVKRKVPNPSYYNPVVVELEVKGLGADYEDADKDTANGLVVDGFDPYEDVESKRKNTTTPAPKESSTPASATNVGELYAVVDKRKKKGAKQKQEEDGCTVTNKDDLYTVPMKKKGKMKNVDEGIAATDSAVKSEDYDDVADLNQCEGECESPNADMLYAVVDKSHKKKK